MAAKPEIIPPSYKFVHQPRTSGRRGGGTGLLYKDSIKVTKVDAGEKTYFEFSEWRLTQGSFRARLVILYRPPYSAEHPATLRMFFDDFTVFL